MAKRKKKKPLSKLAKKKANPNSTYWRGKADKTASRVVRLRDKKCLICGRMGTESKTGFPINGLDAHHIISRTNLKHRYNLLNLITLCKSCHKFGHSGISPHGSGETVEAYWIWLKTDYKMKKHYAFYKANSIVGNISTHNECYNRLKQQEDELIILFHKTS